MSQNPDPSFYDAKLTKTAPSLSLVLQGRLIVIGGGNMARALLGGALEGAGPELVQRVWVIDPSAETRAALAHDFGVHTLAQLADLPAACPALGASDLVLWAVKPQVFAQAAAELPAGCLAQALQASVMAGVTLARISQATGASSLVRTMPNTPALVGQGMTGLFAAPAVTAAQRATVQALLQATGQLLWVDSEADLDSVTAVSGSGPAYVFLVMEAMMAAGREMGLTEPAVRQLVLQTFKGATALALASPDDPAVLRQRVTSPGGTTHAAISHMLAGQLPTVIQEGLYKARERAQELGRD